MTRQRRTPEGALKALRGYEDLGHGVLALQIAEHAVNELEHTGLGATRR